MTNIEIAFKFADTIAKAYLPGVEVTFEPDRQFTTAEGKQCEPGAVKVSAPWSSDVVYLAVIESERWVTFVETSSMIVDELHTVTLMQDILMEDAIWFVLTTPIAWEIHAGVASLDCDNGVFKIGSEFEHFAELRKPQGIYDQKVKNWLSSGDFKEHETVEGIINEACRSFDKTHINDGLTEVVFQGEDGKFYMLEAVIHATEIDKDELQDRTGYEEDEEHA